MKSYPVTIRRFLFKCWFLTLFIGPIFFLVYNFTQANAPMGQIYFITSVIFAISFIISSPTLFVTCMFSLAFSKYKLNAGLHKLLLFVLSSAGILLSFGMLGLRDKNILFFAMAYLASNTLAFIITAANNRLEARFEEPEKLLLLGPVASDGLPENERP